MTTYRGTRHAEVLFVLELHWLKRQNYDFFVPYSSTTWCSSTILVSPIGTCAASLTENEHLAGKSSSPQPAEQGSLSTNSHVQRTCSLRGGQHMLPTVVLAVMGAGSTWKVLMSITGERSGPGTGCCLVTVFPSCIGTALESGLKGGEL